MFISKHLSVSLCSFLSPLNLSKGLAFSSFNIGRFSSIIFNRSFITSLLVIGILLGLFYRLLLENIYRVYVVRLYIPLLNGLRNQCVCLHLQSIKGGCTR